MIHAAHILLLATTSAGTLPTCFSFARSKGRHAFLFPTKQLRSSSNIFYYKSGEPFSERLSQVQSELESVKEEGLQQFILDELISAEKKLLKDFDYVAKVSDSDRDEVRLAKQILTGALKQGREIANEVKEVKRGFEELQAAKILEGTTEDIVAKDVMVEKDLEKVIESVASALKDAEEVLRSAVLTAASQDGFTDEIKDSVIKKLELSAKTVEASSNMADFVAKTARQMVIDDDATLAQMEKTAIKLADAIENTETITALLEGSEGGAEVDALADSLKIASDEMVNDLTAVDNIALAVIRKIEMQAEAVLEMGKKAGQAVGTINAAKTTIEQSNSESDKSLLKKLLQESADKIQVDENAAAELAKAITSDANTDAAAERVISDADRVFDELIDCVKETVDDVVSDYESGDDMDDADAISEELVAVQNEEEKAEKAIKSLEEAKEKVSGSAVEELKGEQIKGEAATPKVESKSGSDSAVEVTNSEPPTPNKDEIGAKASVDGETAGTHDLTDIEKIRDDNKVENVKFPEETASTASIKVDSGESIVDSHEVMTAVSKEVSAQTSAASDTTTANESGGNAVKEVLDHIESIKAPIGAENVAGDASDHIESIKSVITSASNMVEELARSAGDSLAPSIDSSHTPVTESLTQAVAFVTSLSFLHF